MQEYAESRVLPAAGSASRDFFRRSVSEGDGQRGSLGGEQGPAGVGEGRVKELVKAGLEDAEVSNEG